MLAAQLHGKLNRAEAELEDLLTSNVFGTIKYIPPEEGLIPLLAVAVRQDLLIYPLRDIGKISNVTYDFWITLDEPNCISCEPDVLIRITDENENKIMVLVEAKYRSGKSSEAVLSEEKPYDQLAKEWDNLVCIAKRNNSKPYLLYITADIGFPIKDVEASQSDYRRTRKNNMDIVWISWRKLPTIFQYCKHEIIKDLVEILRKQGLILFEGFEVELIESPNWNFESKIKESPSTLRKFSWSYKILRIKWKYNNEIENEYNWVIGKNSDINWRYEK